MIAKKTRILLACVRSAYPRLFAILAGHELELVTALTEARAALKGGRFDLIMIGVHFDESRMFDLLQHVKADLQHGSVPVVCFRGIRIADAQADLVLKGIEAACKEMGANAYFDMLAFTDDTRGNTAIRNIIHGALGSATRERN